MKKLCNSKVYYLMVQGYMKVNSNKNDKYKYKMIVEKQPAMELLE